MRLRLPSTLLSLLVLFPLLSLAQEQQPDNLEAKLAPAADSSTPAGADGKRPSTTVFNGVEVPPMPDLNGDKFEEEVKDGYWYERHHSIIKEAGMEQNAPTWQTLHEFYYASQPVPASKSSKDTQTSLNDFHHYYNFHFGSLDCVAWGSACEKHEINAYPSFVLYKNGQMVKRFTGKKDMAGLSHFVEDALESIRPGSRPKEGLKLPKPGAKSVDTNAKPDAPLAKDKDAAAGAAAGEKHNEKVAQVDTESPSSALPKETHLAANNVNVDKAPKPSKASVLSNPLGTSVSLTAESFQNLVTTSMDSWFIKFYAPWCGHCQALAPNWDQLGKEMKDKLNVGEVNCDVESRLCKDVRLQGYPTIMFFKGGERVEYDGLRGLGDLIQFANKALDIGDGVRDVDAAAFKEMEETEEVIFVYFYDHATTTEDFAAIERVQLSLVGHAKLVKTDSAILADRFKISTWPRLLVSRDGRPSYYSALAPKDMRDYRQVVTWMKSVWLPIVPELTASNAREIMDGKLVVLAVLSRERADEFVIARREMKNAALEWMEKQTQAFQLERQERRDAKQLRIEEAEDKGDQRALRAAKSIRINMEDTDRRDVGFAWVDGIFWERWIRTTYGIDVKEGERVVINDEDSHKFWDQTFTGSEIVPSRTSILETLPRIVANPPKLKPKLTTNSVYNAFFELRGASYAHPYIAFGIMVGVIASTALWGKGRIRRGRGTGGVGGPIGSGGFFRLDGKESLLGVGGTGGGKVD
ncbi:MAG: hypothetical protein M1833_004592 [Piccolia ochrophora]|nr:MAG: hypothetical protein M1833_004592 [Piccolia ochrophora]